jgi:hypothetical protein
MLKTKYVKNTWLGKNVKILSSHKLKVQKKGGFCKRQAAEPSFLLSEYRKKSAKLKSAI